MASKKAKAGIWQRWRQMPLWKKILIGMIMGVATGALIGPQAAALQPLGVLFLNAIKMLIVPLVFASLIVGVTSMQDTSKMGRVGLKSIGFYLGTTAIAVSMGLGFGHLLQPGAGLNMVTAETAAVASDAPTLVQTLVALVPANPLNAMVTGNILQIIVFALALGIALNLSGEKGRPAVAVFESLAEAMYKMTDMVMMLAPYGVFGLMAWVAGTYGLDVLLPLGKVIAAVYIASLLHILGFYGSLIAIVGRLSPVRYFNSILDAQLVAYSTSSSAGTLPVSMETAQKNLGASKSMSSFVLPLGATINMDGTAIYQGVTALFVAQAFGIDLMMTDYLTIIATATLASIGTAGVPGAGLIMLTLVLATVGLPLEGVALIAGIDRILDMMRTTVNVSGDLTATTLIAQSEGELDEDIFYALEVPEAEVEGV